MTRYGSSTNDATSARAQMHDIQLRRESISLEREELALERDDIVLQREEVLLERDRYQLQHDKLRVQFLQTKIDIEELTFIQHWLHLCTQASITPNSKATQIIENRLNTIIENLYAIDLTDKDWHTV